MTKTQELIENIRRDFLDYYNDHKGVVAESLDSQAITVDTEKESLDIDILETMQDEVMEWNSDGNEYYDCYYIAGLVHACDLILNTLKKSEG